MEVVLKGLDLQVFQSALTKVYKNTKKTSHTYKDVFQIFWSLILEAKTNNWTT